MRRRILLAWLVSVAAWAAMVLPAAAKGMVQLVEIEIPGFYQPLRIEDEGLLADLSMGQLENFEASVSTPSQVGAGVVLTRYFLDEGGREVPFDKLAFFSDLDGGPGYVYYLGIVNGSSAYDGRWFAATTTGAVALRQALEAHGVDLNWTLGADGAQWGQVPQALWLAIGALASFGLGWGLAHRRATTVK